MSEIVLITNDDGIESPGLEALVHRVREKFLVYVVAPHKEQSATGHAFTAHNPIHVERRDEYTLVVHGTPTDCVMLGVKNFLPCWPALVLSGINKGPNMGDDVTYSGTVAGAIEGTLLGIPSFAISLVARKDYDFTYAARFAKRLAEMVLIYGLPPGLFLNVNVPNGGTARGVRITRQGRRIYRDRVVEEKDADGKSHWWLDGPEPGWEESENTDFCAVEENMISITPLHLDLTSHRGLTILKKWRWEWENNGF